jgi:hypothetical protein
LRSAANAPTVLNKDTVAVGGLSNTNTFTLGTTFVTGTSTILSNLAGSGTYNGVIFQLVGTVATADFSTQAGINTGAVFITQTIGTSGTVSGQNAIIVLNDTSSALSAIFQFTENGTASGISTNELKLIGVVNGTLSSTNFS